MATETARLGSDLAELNEGFLELVTRGADAGLPADVLARLRASERGAQQRLAAMPFALFGFGFEDDTGWARLLSPGVRDLEPGYVCHEPLVELFTVMALTALRGFVRVAPQSVSAWIGMPVATRLRLAELEIGLLGVVGALAAPRLRGRLATREYFWQQLLGAAENNDRRQLVVLAALGKQWTIRRCLGLEAPAARLRAFRR